MTIVTVLVGRLSAVDAGAADQAAGQLLAYATALRAAVTALTTLPAGWAGTGAQVGAAAAAATGRRLAAKATDCDTAGQALRAVAAGVRSYQGEASAARRVLAAQTQAAQATPVSATLAEDAVRQELEAAWGRFAAVDSRSAVMVAGATLTRLVPLSPSGRLLAPPGSSVTPAAERLTAPPAPLPPQPAAVAVWWAGLGPSARAALAAGWPGVVGSIDGLPICVRDAVNRRWLVEALAAARAAVDRQKLPDLGRELAGSAAKVLPWPASTLISSVVSRSAARRRLASLTAIAQVVARPGRQLIRFDDTGDGLAVVATGDLETAASVAVLVPGLNTELGDVPRLDVQVARIAAAAGPGAVGVAWLGYDAPGLREVVDDGAAAAATVGLARFSAGLRAVGAAGQRVALIGHSYGSLVVGETARTPWIRPVRPSAATSDRELSPAETLSADELVFLASPGVGVPNVSRLVLPPRRVWAGQASTDPIQLVFWPGEVADLLGLPEVSIFGPDPVSAGFGAGHLDTSGAVGHSGYFELDTRSLAEIGAVVAGRPIREKPG